MSSQPNQQLITIHMLHNISRAKGNHTMKLGQLIECNKTFFFKNQAEKEAGKLVPDLLLVFKKVLYEVKASGLKLT